LPRERAEGHEFDFGKGGHLRPFEWLQVAAISKIKLRASCVLNAKFVANEKQNLQYIAIAKNS
jgi:hypothetical protein